MPVYAYADETIFTIDKKTDDLALGCGIFITSKRIENFVIDDALIELCKDEQFDNVKDKRTIERQFFHSSEDSKNGHSYLCKSINENLIGIFDYTYVNKVSQSETCKKEFKENLFKRCLSHSTLEFFLNTEEIFLIVEKRNGLSDETLLKWKNHLFEIYDGSAYNLTSYKTFYPKLNIELLDKREPGLQVVDFLIWAINRTKTTKPDQIWHSRLKYKTWFEYKDIGNQNRAKYHLNTLPEDKPIHSDYPIKFVQFEEWEDFLNCFINIERFLVKITETDFTEMNIHLFDDFNQISIKLNDNLYQLTIGDFKEIGSVFLRLFDTLPIYRNIKDHDEDSWKVLLNCKFLASMLVRNDQIHFNRTKGEIHRWRYLMRTESLREYNELIGG